MIPRLLTLLAGFAVCAAAHASAPCGPKSDFLVRSDATLAPHIT